MVPKFKFALLAFLAILLLLAAPLAAQDKQAEKVYRVGYLSFPPLDAHLDSLRKACAISAISKAETSCLRSDPQKESLTDFGIWRLISSVAR